MRYCESFIFGKAFSKESISLIKKLGIEHVTDDESNLPNIDDPLLKAIAKYENHPSILRIKNYVQEKDLYFSFEFVDKPKVSKELNKLDRKKACQELDIPIKLIRSNKDLILNLYTTNSITPCSVLIFPQN